VGVWYCTREAVKTALDIKETARANAAVDRAIEGASRSIEGFLHRKFYPWLGTRYFNWPDQNRSRAWRLWLDENDLISVTTLVTGGQTIPATDYFLEPVNSGPPYTHIEMDLDSSSAWGGGSTHQRDIAVTGLWGSTPNVEAPVGTTVEALDGSETGVDLGAAPDVGVGDIIRIDDERMIVTGRTMLDTGDALTAGMAAQMNVQTAPVSSGAAFAVGEVILIGAEKMLVTDIAGNNLLVIRAWDGSTLAAHSTSDDVYSARTLTVTRGALGTTAATHLTSATVVRHVVPGLVNQLSVAEAINGNLQELSGYARVAGSGDAEREFTGRALDDLRERCYVAHGRKFRKAAV
jgi:hypothetical protein